MAAQKEAWAMNTRERLLASLAEIRRARNLTAFQVTFKPHESIRMKLTEIRMILTEQLFELYALAEQLDAPEQEV